MRAGYSSNPPRKLRYYTGSLRIKRFGFSKRSQTTKAKATSALPFRDFIGKVNPRFLWYRHCDVLADVLQQVADGERTRVMVFMPPRHGKSEAISRLFSAYYLYCHADRWVGINSYSADLAYTFSRAARDHYTQAGRTIRGDADAVKHWETGEGGGLWAAGVGGPITGKGFHLGIIDDPIKNAEEAASEVIQASHRDWYDSTFYTRAEPDAAIVVVQTRWNEADLSGYLLDKESEEPEGWHVVNLEAIKEDTARTFPPTCTLEDDWRKPGEALCPERYPVERLTKIEARIGNYFWSALFQQRPAPREGNLFKARADLITLVAPADGERVRFWDRAATPGGGDYTVGVLMQRTGGLFYVLDVVRGQWGPDERNATIRQTADLDNQRYGRRITTIGEEEPGSAGKDQAAAFVRLLAGYTVDTERATGDKVTRADAYASQWNAGNVKLLEAAWNVAYINELTAFPNGRHDDQVDGSSGAFNRLAVDTFGFSFSYLRK